MDREGGYAERNGMKRTLIATGRTFARNFIRV